MLKLARATILCTALTLAACSSLPLTEKKVTANLEFQFGQHAEIQLDNDLDPALKDAFLKWVNDGVYTQTPVYRQLPGIFILTGKPRLAGQGFVAGQVPLPEAWREGNGDVGTGDVGLVTHADGTVGPELILKYGPGLITCCEAPQNLRIGTISKGSFKLRSVQRGDNLISVGLKR